MFEKVKEIYENYLIKDITKITYHLYKIDVICWQSEQNFSLTFNKYSIWNKQEIIDYYLIYKKKKIYGIPLNYIREFHVEVVDEIDLYYKSLIYNLPPMFLEKEEIENFNNSYDKEIKLYQKYKVKNKL